MTVPVPGKLSAVMAALILSFMLGLLTQAQAIPQTNQAQEIQQ